MVGVWLLYAQFYEQMPRNQDDKDQQSRNGG
jgi:hypothetical protein